MARDTVSKTRMMIQLTLISMSIPAMLLIRNEPGMAILLFMKVDVVQRPGFSLCSRSLKQIVSPDCGRDRMTHDALLSWKISALHTGNGTAINAQIGPGDKRGRL